NEGRDRVWVEIAIMLKLVLYRGSRWQPPLCTPAIQYLSVDRGLYSRFTYGCCSRGGLFALVANDLPVEFRQLHAAFGCSSLLVQQTEVDEGGERPETRAVLRSEPPVR